MGATATLPRTQEALGIDPESAVRFGDMFTANPVPETNTEFRVDPFWDNMWDYAMAAHWTSLRTKRRLAASGIGRLRATESRWSDVEAMRELATHKPHYRRLRLSALAAVGLWRTMTPDQLAAVVGAPMLASPRSTDRDLLLASGLVQEGRLPAGTYGGGTRILLRPDYRGDFDSLATMVDYADWVGVTSGRGWTQGTQFDRHNLLGTELGLRIAEFCGGVATTFGEGLGTLSTMAPPECGVTTNRAADAVVIREDGLRIAVEVTASVPRRLDEKIVKWAEVLAADTDRTMAVVFVEAAHPEWHSKGAAANVAKALRTAIRDASRSTIAHQMADVPERMMIARWTDWFPTPGTVVPEFISLPALRPTGGGVDDRWQRVDMLDPGQIPAPRGDTTAALAAVANANALYGTPHWLRDPSRGPDLDRLVREHLSLDSVPKLPPSRRTVGRRSEARQADSRQT